MQLETHLAKAIPQQEPPQRILAAMMAALLQAVEQKTLKELVELLTPIKL